MHPLPGPTPPHLTFSVGRPDLLPIVAPLCCRRRRHHRTGFALNTPPAPPSSAPDPPPALPSSAPGVPPYRHHASDALPALASCPSRRLPGARRSSPALSSQPALPRVLLQTGSTPAPKGPRRPCPPLDRRMGLTLKVLAGPCFGARRSCSFHACLSNSAVIALAWF
jgi:hypothetical protein